MIGETLGRYTILEKIGQGGMGEVFLAEDASLHRKVALKFLPPEMQRDDTARRRFIREARSAAALDHPYICHINEVGESEGRDFIVMEYVTGQSLKDRLLQGPVPVADTLRVAVEVAEALEAAHGKGIIHRDIKPANIMLTQTGHAKVMDFGLAKQVVVSEGREAEDETVTALTGDGSAVGTLAYMSPEQLRGQAVDGRSDIWALGVMLYEMAAGVRPFHGQSGFALSSAIMNEAPRPLPAEVPVELGAVIGRCLVKDVGKRYQKAHELLVALDAIGTGRTAPWTAWRYRLERRRWLALAVTLLVTAAILVGLDVGGLRRRLTGEAGNRAQAIRLAVLPFANLTGDPEQEFLSDGVTQEMISQLGRLHPQSLSVIARTSVMRYKKTDKPIDQIGRELGVDYVLEGSARKEATRIRVSAELIQVRDQTQLWADTYERELSGILALQSDVARQVAAALALKLLPAEEARLRNVRTVNPEAYEAYLKGSQHWIKMTKGDLDTAEQYFQLALQKEPDYAAAYAGMTYVWACRNQMGLSLPAEAVPKMKAAALRATSLDETLADGHYALAGVWTWHDWNITGAGQEWKRAIELNPNYPEGLATYAHFLMLTSHPDEAAAAIERALKLDPFNVTVHTFYAAYLAFVRRYDDALVQCRTTLKMQPDNLPALATSYLALSAKGMGKEALDAVKRYLRVYSIPDLDSTLDRRFAEAGFRGAMARAGDVLAERARQNLVLPTDIAGMYIQAGDKDRTLEWLERAYEARDPNLPYVKGPDYDSLRSDPRFQSILRRIGLPQ